MKDFFNKIGKLSGQRRRARSVPVILHVGANGFGQDSVFYTELIAAFREIPFRIAVVEPDDIWNQAIAGRREKAMNRVKELVRIEIANVAVVSSCQKEVDFHRLSYQLALDYNISYTDWTRVGFGGAGLSKDNLWLSMLQNQELHPVFEPVHNMSLYLETYTVPCVTPTKLLEKLGVDPQDLVFVAIDAELQDGLIVEELLDVGAQPAVWVFESDRPFACYSQQCVSAHAKGANSLVPKLRRRGYRIGKNCEGVCVDDEQHNLVAVYVGGRREV